ncbi:MAG: DNA primase [Endomicrobiales bacterium]|nr:DNA primase [Endomicrobiales bacterium]
MSIPSETIDKIRLSTDIVEIVREYIPTIKKAGRNWRALCPFHHEKTPSFMVSPEKGIFHCFGCHAGGDAFKFIMQIDNLTWPEAVKKLGARAGIEVRETREDIVRSSERQKIYDLLESAADFYHRCLKESQEAAPARKYLEKRGVNKESIEKFRLGYAPQNLLVSQSSKKGYTTEQLIKAGIVTRTDRGKIFEYMSGRLVFPIYNAQGNVVAFGGRTLKDEKPKYINSPETSVFLKSTQLYGLYQAIPTLRKQRETIILEGYMDVVMSHQFGINNAVATLGTAYTSQHSHILQRYSEKITLIFDSDSAGNQAASRAIDSWIDSELNLKVVSLPENMDPDEYLLKYGNEDFLSFINREEKPAVEFLTKQSISLWGCDTPESKNKVVQDIRPFYTKLNNAILKQEWVKYLAERIKTSEDAVKTELEKRKKEADKDDLISSIKTMIRSAEEEILQIISVYPQYRNLVSEELFKHRRNRKVCQLILKDVPISDIVNHLEQSEVSWFTELVVEDKEYKSPEQVLVNLLRDLRYQELRDERARLEKEVIPMLDGDAPKDESKIEMYKDLIKQLQGSVK